MSDSNSTRPPAASKALHPTTPEAGLHPTTPGTPYQKYPLFRHASGQWAKKVRGKLVYFGKDAEQALNKYLREKDDLHAGRKPREEVEAVTVRDVVNKFRNAKQHLTDAGELSPRTMAEYIVACDLVIARLGKQRLITDLRADDFATLRRHMAKTWGAHRLAKMIQYVRSIFKHGFDADLIEKAVKFGPGFKRPSKKVHRLERAKRGPKLFTRDEVNALIDTATPPMKAMLLLAINAGMGNGDCANLTTGAIDLERGWMDFPRPKTGIDRRAKLWPETIAALQGVLADRPTPKDSAHGDLVFVTKYGDSWSKETGDNPVSKEMRKLLKKLKIGRKGLGFYALRHVFRTVADETLDQVAVDYAMGHEVPGMNSHYRERISDQRLQTISDYVHAWLFAPAPAQDRDADQAAAVLPFKSATA